MNLLPPADDERPAPSLVPEAPHAWLLITGDPVGGYVFRGPYATRSDAEDAQANLAIQLRMDGYLAKLYEP